jgi:TolB-like protein/Tfp pilus assembly protein PilF
VSLFEELKRRNVFRVGIAYVVVAWLVAQVLELALDSFGSPEWVMKTVLTLMAAGLPFALFFAWAFELTPEGLKKEKDVDRSESITHVTGRKLDFTIIAVLLVALGYFAWDKFAAAPGVNRTQAEAGTEPGAETSASAGESAPAAVESDPSIAVLPFVNMSSDPEQEFFSDGLSEELLNLLANIPELKVASRSSAFQFKGEKIDIPDVAQKLNVAHVLEGSVRKSGNQVRITAQLIKADDGYHVWSETYDRTLEDIFAVQDEIALEVVTALKLTLLEDVPHVIETDPETYAVYLQGRHLARQSTAEANKRAGVLLEQVVADDPQFAPAWIELSRLYRNQTVFGVLNPEFNLDRSREAAERALSIAPDYGPALARMGFVIMDSGRDLNSATGYIKQAIAKSPNDASTLGIAAQMSAQLGRCDQALELYQRATDLDPVDPISHEVLGRAYWRCGHDDKAIAALKTAQTMNPVHLGIRYFIGLVLLAQGDAEAALAEFEQETSDEEYRVKGMAMAYHTLGRTQEYDKAMAELIEKWGEMWPSEVAHVYAWVGDVDSAFEWLDKAVASGEAGLEVSHITPILNSLHDDPRWQPFLANYGISEAQLAEVSFELN